MKKAAAITAEPQHWLPPRTPEHSLARSCWSQWVSKAAHPHLKPDLLCHPTCRREAACVTPRVVSSLQKHYRSGKTQTLEENFNLHYCFRPWGLIEWISEYIFCFHEGLSVKAVGTGMGQHVCGRAESIDSPLTMVHLSLQLSGFSCSCCSGCLLHTLRITTEIQNTPHEQGSLAPIKTVYCTLHSLHDRYTLWIQIKYTVSN